MTESSQVPDKSDAQKGADFTKDRRLWAIFLIVLIDVLGITIILPLLPFYSEHFGATPLTVGILVSSYAVCQLIAAPILGYWSDKVGRKPVLIISQIGTFIGFLVLARADSLLWIFISRIIDGLTSGNLSTAQAYISDVASPKVRAQALGKIGVAFGIGFFVGPALTGILSHFGYQAPILAAAGLSFLSIMASIFLLPKETAKPKATQEAAGAKTTGATAVESLRPSTFLKYFARPGMSALLLEIFLFFIMFSAYVSGFALFAERRFTFHGVALNAKQIGYAFAYFGLCGIIIQGFMIGKLVEKFGERRVALQGFIAAFIGYVILSFVHAPVWILVTGVFTSFGNGVLRAVLTSEIAGKVSPHERGTIMGVVQSLQSIGQILAPIGSTLLIEHVDLTLWPLFPAVICLVGIILVVNQRHMTSHARA